MKRKSNRFFYSLKILLACILLLNASLVRAKDLMIAAAAGYKKPVSEIIKSFEKESAIKTDAVFGNIQMIASQAKQTGEITCIIGDKKFLAALDPTVKFTSYQPMGKGILVLAFRKGLTIKKPEEMASDRIKSLFVPEDKKAIYGIAGTEALKSYRYTDTLSAKVTRVATVPQVVSYLLTGEADAGFINLTEAMANKDKLGGYIIIPDDKYSEIQIVAGIVKGFENNPETLKFINYLNGNKAKDLLKKYGLK